ncbi:MAG: three-Cys-motif partner protein TcmP [Candidatus Omnitrophica bacterium]|nr:three-Cys-motif partner protein TcmP [Candidatus Omnitrophota bacterium]
MKIINSKIDGLIVRPSGPWIKQKYFYFKRYLDILTKGMKNKWAGNLTFVDLFAGPGRCLIEKTNEDIEGSSLISLQYGFRQYIFIEEQKELIKVLEERCRKSPEFSKIVFLQGDCNGIVEETIRKIDSSSLSLIFADPTGLDLHFSTIEQITLQRKVDLLLNIQFGTDIKRNFKLYKKQGDSSKLGLFLGGEVNWSKVNLPIDAIKLYKEVIGRLGFKTVEFKDITIKNTMNTPMYFLLFASKNPRGLDFWKKTTVKDLSGQPELF